MKAKRDRSEYMRTYNQSEAGRASKARYRASERGKEKERQTQRKYAASEKGRAVKSQAQRKLKYGMTDLEFEAMKIAQSGACAICEQPFGEKICVDHDRSCCPGRRTCGSCIRGLLCSNCNVGIGLLGDDPDVLDRAARYVRADDQLLRVIRKGEVGYGTT